jgi:hypothetical protein
MPGSDAKLAAFPLVGADTKKAVQVIGDSLRITGRTGKIAVRSNQPNAAIAVRRANLAIQQLWESSHKIGRGGSVCREKNKTRRTAGANRRLPRERSDPLARLWTGAGQGGPVQRALGIARSRLPSSCLQMCAESGGGPA